MELTAERVRIGSKFEKDVKKIYFDAFRDKDRMPWWLLMLLATLPGPTALLAYRDGDRVVGMIYMATLGRLAFIMFFAVDEALRSKGYGSRILEKVRERHPEGRRILSIEPCDEAAPDLELRCRRKEFYRRNGYLESGYMLKLNGEEQEILAADGDFSKAGFAAFLLFYGCGAIWPNIYKKAEK